MSTAIEWTDETWNPVVGCERCSPGCDHCYAIRVAAREMQPAHVGLTEWYRTADRLDAFMSHDWNGTVRMLPERLDVPLHWRKPRRCFVCSMSDLFHPDVPAAFVARVFATMSLATEHTFQVLTKRPQRARGLLTQRLFVRTVDDWRTAAAGDFSWPLPNVWLGTSVENQRYSDMRIPHLLNTPAAVRFLSIEPLLGPVDITDWLYRRLDIDEEYGTVESPPVDWVIVGGESGPGARPMHPDWVRTIRDQCVAAGVPFFFKQWGEWAPSRGYRDGTHLIQVADGRVIDRASATSKDPYGTGSGPQDLVDRGHAGWTRIVRAGKKAAGRELDGRSWNDMPDHAAIPAA